ncbi:MAG TPA: PQQ-binding-like beta-propeller repeat protein [Candidatus Eisenbacteria bacterium]|nr:PQQ-binding-like beta-propeller repeat protein [Candidatus Eisenbacteria bacterium]
MFSTPAVVGDVVCVGSCAGIFFALDRVTGQPRDQCNVSADGVRRQFHGDALLDGELLLIGSDTDEGDTAYVFAFERGTAKVRWRKAVGSGVMSDLAHWKGRAYAVTVMDELICFDPASAASYWTYRPPAPAYEYRGSAPVVVGDRVLFADHDGTIRGFEASSGRLLWEAPQVDRLTTWMVGVDSSVLFMRGTDALVTVDPRTGREQRRRSVSGGPYSGPITLIGDSLLLLTGPKTLTAFDLERDRVRWSHPATQEWTSSRPFVWRDMALAADHGRLIAYGLADGALRWAHELRGTARAIGTHGDTLYVGMLKGQVHALVDSSSFRSRRNGLD